MSARKSSHFTHIFFKISFNLIYSQQVRFDIKYSSYLFNFHLFFSYLITSIDSRSYKKGAGGAEQITFAVIDQLIDEDVITHRMFPLEGLNREERRFALLHDKAFSVPLPCLLEHRCCCWQQHK